MPRKAQFFRKQLSPIVRSMGNNILLNCGLINFYLFTSDFPRILPDAENCFPVVYDTWLHIYQGLSEGIICQGVDSGILREKIVFFFFFFLGGGGHVPLQNFLPRFPSAGVLLEMNRVWPKIGGKGPPPTLPPPPYPPTPSLIRDCI